MEYFITFRRITVWFKKNFSCTNAIYILRSVVEYYCDNDSTVNTRALDISEAFDHVDQYALLNLMIDKVFQNVLL